MDQFEAARLKTAKREAQKARYAASPLNDGFDVSEPAPALLPPVQVPPNPPKEKPKKDGRFIVSVEMPHTAFTFILTKPSILSHASANRLTRDEIKKHVMEGLRPLLGGLE